VPHTRKYRVRDLGPLDAALTLRAVAAADPTIATVQTEIPPHHYLTAHPA
jgi:hypothetical protein